ncbi:Uncharacterised protein [Enterobacter hormaechei]|nr:Uncharacterised protein [Enterobacter hormaechei]
MSCPYSAVVYLCRRRCKLEGKYCRKLCNPAVKRGYSTTRVHTGIADLPLPRSLTRYARPFGCGERYRQSIRSYPQIRGITEGERCEQKRPRRSRFSIGFAPLMSITESDAQISGGETRQDYKDPGRFPPVAPSCALLFLPFGLPVSFRCYGRGSLIPRLTLSSG